MSLGLNSSAWEAAVTASPEVLQQDGSAKSVAHVLSKAVTRSPQKLLAQLVCGANFEPTLRSAAGKKIIQSLIDYGTVRTVSLVCSELERTNIVSMNDVDGTALIIRSVALRVDDSSEARQSLLKSVTKSGVQDLMMSKWALTFAAEVALSDEVVFAKLVSNAKAQTALKTALASAVKPKEAIHFVEVLLAKSSEPQVAKVSELITGAIADALKAKAEHKPREEVLMAVASHADAKYVSNVAVAISSWPNLSTFVVKSEGARVVASLLARAEHKAGAVLANAILSCVDMKEVSSSRKATILSVLTTLQQQFPECCKQHKVSATLISAAEVKLTRSTKPAFVATKEKILQKIRDLEQQKQSRPAEPSPAAPKGKKRRTE
jgi:hypothetical protein